ncbi:MAG TPA: hypothetical protein DDW55_12845 [Gammaproteobacteria bacterium]|nr:hypothetical protein [Gammaproteobacteria bacterium]
MIRKKRSYLIIGRLSILVSSFIPGLAMADGVAGAVLDLVIPPAYATIPEPGILPLMAVGVAVAVAVKFSRRKK